MSGRVLIAFLMVAHAHAGDVEDALARGRAARADGVPQAAIYDLKRAAAHASGALAPKVVVELTRCLLAAESGREREAINWCRRTIYRDQPEVIFWRAQALAQNGEYEAAFADYRRAASDPALRVMADFGAGRMLEAQGRHEEALEIYATIPADSDRHIAAELARAAVLIKLGRFVEGESLLEGLEPSGHSEREMQRYLLGRIALETGRIDAATRIYEVFQPRDRRLAAGLAIGEAEVLSRGDKNGEAEERIEEFVRENPGSPLLGQLLAKLDEVRSRQKEPSNAALKQWEKDDENEALSAVASFYLARGDERQGRGDRAIRNYDEFIRRYPAHPLRATATVRLARLLLAAGKADEAGALLAATPPPGDRADEAKLRFLRGATEYQSGDFSAATRTFVGAANLDPAIAESALANAAVAAIETGRDPLAAEILSALRRENPVTARRIELAQAFASARAENPDSGEQLALLASKAGAVGDRAALAVAEWNWRQGRRDEARAAYRRVANSSAAGMGDQKDYFAVYLADDGSARAADAVVQAARDFLSRHPDSPREADVRMKWGEVLMRTGDFRGARVQFEEAGRSTSDAGLRQSALYLAARAASKSMAPEELEAAIQLLEDVAREKGGDLAAQARWEQAMLQSALQRYEDAVKILDSLIATTKDPRMSFAARLKRGEALLELGRKQPERISEAIAEWRAIAASPDVLPSERNEALTLAAAASERAGDIDGALAAYYEALTAPRDQQPEFFWYYKAGFAAAQLLHSRNRFKEEAAIYEKMAANPGPRANEAKDRAKRLRLENFIWDN